VSIRSRLARIGVLRRAWRRAQAARQRLVALLHPGDYDALAPEQAVHIAYQVMLGRVPDAVGLADYGGQLRSGRMTRQDLALALRGSEEFCNTPRFSAKTFGNSIHTGRCRFVRSLPPARRIVDLGGTHLGRDIGAMVALGYPYPFDELVIVDLPPEARHAIYRSSGDVREVASPLGPVRYRYHSMTDLSGFDDAGTDLVYSGQSIEHVTRDDGATVLKEVFRILRPGGHFALDTPNARVTRLQQEHFIDPDHKVEYRHEELSALLEGCGFEIVDAKGLNHAGRSLAEGRFDIDEVAGNVGCYAAIEDCYILCYVCRKPAV